MIFSDLHLSDALLKAVDDSGYTDPTAIQAAAIPAVLMGRDLIGVAQTGTGKTASFVLPMIDILSEGRSRARMPRSLILEPTRELAAQVAENFVKYGKYHKLSMALLIGGVAFGDQDRALEKGVDVLIATPGRLMDQHGRGKILLSGVDILVIDEADRMLDMGFIPDVEKICSYLKPERQTLLFSATMPPPIKRLADTFMTNPKIVEVSRPATTNKDIAQSLVVTSARDKRETLRELLREEGVKNAIIFCNRKTTVRDLASSLKKARLKVGQIHGDMEQADRIRELDKFKNDEIDILVASDVAARGLDIKGVSHVINYDSPWHPDDYVHRIGRTGRAGMKGTAITLVTPDDEEAIAQIEKLTGQTIPRRDLRQPAAARPAARAPEPATDAADISASDEPKRDRTRPRASRQPKVAEARPPHREPRREAAPAEPRREAAPAKPRREAAPAERPARAERPEPRADRQPRRDDRRPERRPEFQDQRQDGRRDEREDRDLPLGPGFGDEGVPAFLQVSARG